MSKGRNWEDHWASRGGDEPDSPRRPVNPQLIDERPAVSPMRYAPMRADGGCFVLTVPGLGVLRVFVKEHPEDPTGRLELTGLAIGA